MNFLAHIYLSGDDDLVKIGNFMADGIRGKQFKTYSAPIQKGILLHRAIDTFTDAHPVFRKSTKKLHEKYHHYSGVIIDIFYDHFLAKNWSTYSDEKLEDFVNRFYNSLHANFESLSEKTQNLMPIMLRENWLVSYQSIEGIQHILTQMDRRTKDQSKMKFATAELIADYEIFEFEFTLFFEDMIAHAHQKSQEL